ncbi:NUDIX domain-containing protein [Cutibacterium avidum]|uniref:NUDIX domain-containing protein n=2 Tax=Cutibacterium avidum TaxID=33010 RepID=UPI000391312C|nr:NUDIX domain-containing protein [Cutibacterium avidum]ERF58136.1 NUDIX family hydrolase [Cutibacterium avidum TM16]MCO6634669.1 NUDIX domain-containing protein [Cutibacterium avidum]MCO6658718.1 NUDIX domain-containing protein [Cutibacterium avidum]MCO6669196.1 NUDIX domain-containing protein [Cutibacterium avidum]MCO6680708.1 NUDIX domain-containing protein [Cutibacterium avidum]
MDMKAKEIRVRAAGIMRTPEGILLQRKQGDKVWALPGGRVEIGERTAEALVREFDEEFSLRITVGERVAVLENLFSHRGVEFHSIEFYYHVTPTVSLIEGITAQESDLETEFWTPKCGLEVRPVQCVELLRRGW